MRGPGFRMERGDKTVEPKRRVDWFIFVMIGIIGYFSWTFVMQQSHLNAVEDSYGTAQARLETAKQAHEELQQEKAQLEDPVYIEKVAREDLGMVRKGELPYISANSRK